MENSNEFLVLREQKEIGKRLLQNQSDDRGHQAPLATFKGKNWQETNYTTNITPQKPQLNRGVWLDLERYERSLPLNEF